MPDTFPHQPIPEGLSASGIDVAKAELERKQAKFSSATSLTDLADEYSFYTPALLYLHGRLQGREPYVSFMQESGYQTSPLQFNFPQRLFVGLDAMVEVPWACSVWALPHAEFQQFISWIGSLTLVDRAQAFVARVRYREVSVADPLFMARQAVLPAVLPEIKITALCLDTNHGCYYLADAINSISPPMFAFLPNSYADTQLFAAAVLGEHSDPYGVLEAARATDNLSAAEIELRWRVHKARTEKEQNERTRIATQ